jgi:hypothetical protein
MKKESALRYVGFNTNNDREKDDFYPTPSAATQVLLDRQKFTGNVLEPACGDGAMSKVMIVNGYEVHSSDLFDRGYGKTGVNFLETTEKYDNINKFEDIRVFLLNPKIRLVRVLEQILSFEKGS